MLLYVGIYTFLTSWMTKEDYLAGKSDSEDYAEYSYDVFYSSDVVVFGMP